MQYDERDEVGFILETTEEVLRLREKGVYGAQFLNQMEEWCEQRTRAHDMPMQHHVFRKRCRIGCPQDFMKCYDRSPTELKRDIKRLQRQLGMVKTTH